MQRHYNHKQTLCFDGFIALDTARASRVPQENRPRAHSIDGWRECGDARNRRALTRSIAICLELLGGRAKCAPPISIRFGVICCLRGVPFDIELSKYLLFGSHHISLVCMLRSGMKSRLRDLERCAKFHIYICGFVGFLGGN